MDQTIMRQRAGGLNQGSVYDEHKRHSYFYSDILGGQIIVFPRMEWSCPPVSLGISTCDCVRLTSFNSKDDSDLRTCLCVVT